jgi:hypothetical protein
VCDVALMNTYYFGKMKFNEKNPEQKYWAKATQLILLLQIKLTEVTTLTLLVVG